jgi:ribosomal subunit interface protein
MRYTVQIRFYGKHIGIGDSLKQYIKDILLSKGIKRASNATSASINVQKDGPSFATEIILHDGTHHEEIVAHGVNKDPYGSVDIAISKMAKQINKRYDKMKNRHKKHKEEKQLRLMMESIEKQGVV